MNLTLRFIIIAVIAVVLGGGGFFFYKWTENRSDKQLAAIQAQATAAGLAQGQKQIADANSAALVAQMKQIAAMTADTNQQMSRIRVDAASAKTKINDFEVQKTAVDHPEVVENWANKTTNDLFAGIQQATQPEATDPK